MTNISKWQAVEEKLAELRSLVGENWSRGEWELAALGERVIRTVEQSKASAREMRQKADDLTDMFQRTPPNS